MNKRVLKQFLKAGFMQEGVLFPTEDGTPQGGAISPTLANMTLNGMHGLLQEHFEGRTKVTVVRYADDFVVTTKTREDAEEAMAVLIPFLAERGLELSKEKTVITHISDGFDFLGFNFRRYDNDKLLIKPSKKAFDHIREKVREIVLGRGKAATQASIIVQLNSVVRGWCNYYRKCGLVRHVQGTPRLHVPRSGALGATQALAQTQDMVPEKVLAQKGKEELGVLLHCRKGREARRL